MPWIAGGASAGLAKQLRLRLEGLLPASLGRLAAALLRAREATRERWPDAAERRQIKAELELAQAELAAALAEQDGSHSSEPPF